LTKPPFSLSGRRANAFLGKYEKEYKKAEKCGRGKITEK
jgi:hypothetical protein